VFDRLPLDEFVGRRSELDVFARVVEDARNGLPAVVLVGGDAGIGKTTLVREGALRARVPVYLGRSTHIGGDIIALAPLVDLLRQVRRSARDVRTDTSDFAPLRDWFARVPELSEASQGGLFVAVLELLTLLAADDVVVVGFEDLHWADEVTWDLFEYLARNLIDERVVLVGTYRANEVDVRPTQRLRIAELSRLASVHRIHLEGLSPDEVSARVAALIGTTAPVALVDQVLARGQGNPFFTQELVAAHLAGETIPVVLSDLISAEIAGLDNVAREVLGAVGAIGRETNHDLLRAIVDGTEGELETAVRTVIDLQLLVVDHDAYRFRHPLVGEVVYADLLPPQRQRLHRKIAETLPQQSAERVRRADLVGELAFHLDRSGDRLGAFLALLDAADAAEAVAPAAAFRHLERAFQLWETLDETETLASRSDRLWQAADIATSTVGNKRAADLARAAFTAGLPPLGAAWGHERLGRYLWSSGQIEESRVEFRLAADSLSGDEGAENALVFAGLGQAELMSGHYAAAEEWCMKVFDVVTDPADNPGAWVMARRVLGVVRSNAGEPDEAVALCREAVVAAASAQGRALATLYLCVALVDAGSYQAAINTGLDAVADGHITGLDGGFGCYFDSLAAESLIRLGRWSEAATVIARHPVANTLPVGLLRLARAEALLAARMGNTDRALAHLAEANALPVDGWHQSVLDASIAEVHLALGNWNEALHAADRGWESNRKTSVLWAARFAMFSVVATVERTLDERARHHHLDVSETIRHLQARIDESRVLAAESRSGAQRETAAHLAHAKASLGRLTEPDVNAWVEARACWAEIGDRWMLASALLREAEAAAQTGAADRAAGSLQQAHAVASELSAALLLSEIDAVSRRTRISVEARPVWSSIKALRQPSG
jgi:tetratricopeptide (TPR) repeat protein